MILAEEFSRSQIARTADFSTSRYERGVFWMRERNAKRRRLDSEEDDQVQRDQAHFSLLKARPIPCAIEIDPSYGRLPPSLSRPGKNYVLTRGILLAQFASPTGKALADAVELISAPAEGADGEESVRLVDGVDLNCVSHVRERTFRSANILIRAL
jgi:tRNA-dihydrouridine synthase 4